MILNTRTLHDPVVGQAVSRALYSESCALPRKTLFSRFQRPQIHCVQIVLSAKMCFLTRVVIVDSAAILGEGHRFVLIADA